MRAMTEIYSTNLTKDQFDFALIYAALNFEFLNRSEEIKILKDHECAVARVNDELVPAIIVKMRNRYAAAYVSKDDGNTVVFECEPGMRDVERAEFFDIIVQISTDKPVDPLRFLTETIVSAFRRSIRTHSMRAH